MCTAVVQSFWVIYPLETFLFIICGLWVSELGQWNAVSLRGQPSIRPRGVASKQETSGCPSSCCMFDTKKVTSGYQRHAQQTKRSLLKPCMKILAPRHFSPQLSASHKPRLVLACK